MGLAALVILNGPILIAVVSHDKLDWVIWDLINRL